MKKRICQLIVVILFPLIIFSGCERTLSFPDDTEQLALITAERILDEVPFPGFRSIGGEWAVIGVCQSGIPEKEKYCEEYKNVLEQTVIKKKGILSEAKPTEYGRAVIGAVFSGLDPGNIGGYNLINPLDNRDAVKAQGINGVSYSVIASKIAGYSLFNIKEYIDDICLYIENCDEVDSFNTDYISMCLQALSLCNKDEKTESAIKKGLEILSSKQEENGSYGNCESTAEAITALTQLRINIYEDKRFIKNGKTCGDGLLLFRLKDGSFCHSNENREPNIMATESALKAIDSVKLFEDNERFYEVLK